MGSSNAELGLMLLSAVAYVGIWIRNGFVYKEKGILLGIAITVLIYLTFKLFNHWGKVSDTTYWIGVLFFLFVSIVLPRVQMPFLSLLLKKTAAIF
jgi:hypothetical protein